jgi:hypothetical protein
MLGPEKNSHLAQYHYVNLAVCTNHISVKYNKTYSNPSGLLKHVSCNDKS